MPASHEDRNFEYFPLPKKKVVDSEATAKAKKENPEAATVYKKTEAVDRAYVHRYVINDPTRIQQMEAKGWVIWRDPETRETRVSGGQILMVKRRADYVAERKAWRDDRNSRIKRQGKNEMDKAIRRAKSEPYGERFELEQSVIKE